MTVRTRNSSGVLVYAGTRAELAAVAEEYANGDRSQPRDCSADLFRRVAAELRTGHPVHDLGPVRFYSDRADGAPYRGPLAPDPDPAWLQRQQRRSSARP